jgi:choline-sulfatase
MRLLWIAAALVLAPPAAYAGPPRKLNVLILAADDHAAYVCGAYGNKQVRTPNLDRLAKEGMRFDAAFANCPMCTPSRQSFLTGRYPRTIGVTQLRTALPGAEDTLAKMLQRAGYATAAIGKMHFNSNLKHGFDLRLDLPEYRQWLKKKGATRLPRGVDVLPQWRPFKDPARTWLNSMAAPYPAVDEDMAGTWFARQAIKYLEEHKDRPFFLMVSFNEPHSPFHFPVEFRGRHKPASFTVPKVGREDDWQIPAIFRDLTDREKQGIIAAYHTSVEFMDRNVGTVLDALRRLGLEEDTLVIYFGDHGYMLGHHGRFEKHCLFLEAVRVPLLIRVPGRSSTRPPRGQSTTAMVELIDVVPTVLNYCKQPVPGAVQGLSLGPLLDGAAVRHRDEVFVEYSENEEALVRTDRWHFIYGTGKRERQDGYTTGRPLPGRTVLLYDVESDPGQTTNLAQRPEYASVVAELTRRLAEHLRRTARQPELIPQGDVHAVLEHCLQPRDAPPPAKGKKKQ